MTLDDLTAKWSAIAADEQQSVDILVYEGMAEPYLTYSKEKRDMAKSISDDLTSLKAATTAMVPPMVARFRRDKWSATRIIIDAMKVGEIKRFEKDEYHNARESAVRLADAYADGRRWEVTKLDVEIQVKRVS